MINVDVTLFIQMANVLLLLIAMNFVLYRPIRRMLAQRRQFIADQQGRVDQVDAEAAAAVQEFNAKIQDARRQGRDRIQELKAAAYEQEKSLLQQSATDANQQLQEIRAKIHKDIAAARDQLKGQVKAFSSELASKILGRSVRA